MKPHKGGTSLTMRSFLATIWAYLVVALNFLAAWLITLVLNSQQSRRNVVHFFSKAGCFLAGLRIRRTFETALPKQAIYVANHASYLDVPIIYSTLPMIFAFVAKSELQKNRVLGSFFERLGTKFVERGEALQAPAALRRMEEALNQGDSLFFFPEGTFRAESGLLPFRSGAYFLAAKWNLPIVPISVRGTRDVFRCDRWYLKSGIITVTVHPPISPVTTENMEEVKERSKAIIHAAIGERKTAG